MNLNYFYKKFSIKMEVENKENTNSFGSNSTNSEDSIHLADINMTKIDYQEILENVPWAKLGKVTACYEMVAPEGLEIKKTKEKGIGIFALKPFKKGEILYKSYEVILKPNKDGSLPMDYVYDIPGVETIPLKVGTHFGSPDNFFRLYGFDVLMNHSCDPNSVTLIDSQQIGKTKVNYDQVAIKDIQVGEEITCNYALSVWEYGESSRVPCYCGTEKCEKNLIGFSQMNPKVQKELLHFAHPIIQTKYNYKNC